MVKFLTWYPSSRMWSGRAASRLAVAPEDPVAPAAPASVEPAPPAAPPAAAPLPESMAARSSAARSAGGGLANARRIRGSWCGRVNIVWINLRRSTLWFQLEEIGFSIGTVG